MDEGPRWQAIHEFWFPPGLGEAGPEAHRDMFVRWFGGGMNAGLTPFAPVVEAARAGRLAHWLDVSLGRLSLILVLDQFPRGLFAGTPAAYACDPDALRVAEEGLRNGQYEALTRPWERMFFAMPLAHAEGPGHLERLGRVVALAERVAMDAPGHLQPLYRHSVRQARGHLDTVARFGRFPHRNPVLGRASTPEESAYLERGDFVHTRMPPRG